MEIVSGVGDRGEAVYTFTDEKNTVIWRERDYGLLVRLELRLDIALPN